ncbi:FecCD family ABC transporter permease [Micropruina glycogenica]|uniref:Iron-enterobactin transporter subunit membrane component of ABC superfamily n=1 Tax=Micropruina glycogenica TaxID=75385 RepID=A0A2N9JDZ5_9ACTN|nr:iron ABC transporter permease [Micropruina glycogenica]SPD86362.1 iron-enterobactin transporter subunit; membrane component of ABC superfamily [Micropruina glycogenica]
MSAPAFAAVRSIRLSATATLTLGLAVVLMASLALGSNPISPALVVQALLDPASDVDSVVWGSRVPRTLLGIVVGFCLGVAGVVMQGQTGNPLADPGLFGVSAGASLAVVLGAFVLGHNSMTASLFLAMLGALVASVLVFAIATLSRDLANPVPLAIAGTAVSALLGAVISFLVLTNAASLEAYRVWVVGSLSGRGLDGLPPALVVAAVGLVLALLNVRSLNSLTLGTELAQGLGETLWRARLVGLGAITLTTASAVALAGPIGFIGLTAPHIGRALVGGNHCRLLPASGLVGAITLLACDVVGRVIGGQAEVPVGVVLATLGGVAFVVIVRRTKLAAL